MLESGRERELAAAIRAQVPRPADVERAVAGVIERIRSGGDAALRELRRRFEGDGAPERTLVPASRMREALEGLDPGLREALELAGANIRAVAEAESTRDATTSLPQGHEVVLRELPVAAAGIYAPGGRAAYPSTVLMCCIPARVAGVERVVLASPTAENGEPHNTVMAAAGMAGVSELHAMGGAQAIAALALGTETIEPVDVIVGPGNAYVQEAKRQLFGEVGIDGIAGPSEVVVVADGSTDPTVTALDLAAQAEHGDDSLAVLIADVATLDAVEAEYAHLDSPGPSPARGRLCLVESGGTTDAVELVNAIAPEHLELHCEAASELAARVRNAGAIFVGPAASAVFGDYVTGSNHVLPTGGAARFAGPGGPSLFRRTQALVSLPDEAARALAPCAAGIARAEGFPMHAEAALARAKE